MRANRLNVPRVQISARLGTVLPDSAPISARHGSVLPDSADECGAWLSVGGLRPHECTAWHRVNRLRPHECTTWRSVAHLRADECTTWVSVVRLPADKCTTWRSVTPVFTRQFDEGVLTPICFLLHVRAHISMLTASGLQVDSFLRSSNGRMYPAPDRRRWWLFGPLSAMRRLTFLCNRDSVIPLPLNRQRRSCGQFLKQAGEPVLRHS